MGYQLTLNDVSENNGGYQLTANDIANEGTPSPNMIPGLQNSLIPNPANDQNEAYRLGGDVITGMTNFSKGIQSAPYNIVNSINPAAGQYINQQASLPLSLSHPIGSLNTLVARGLRPDTTNYGADIYGNITPTLIDKLVQGGTQYAPFSVASSGLSALPWIERALGQGATGGVYNALQSSNPNQGQIPSMLAGSLGETGATVLGVPIRKGLNYLSQFSAPSIFKDIQNGLTNKATNEDAFDRAQLNLATNYAPQEKDAWDSLKSNALMADSGDIAPRTTVDFSGHAQDMAEHAKDLDKQLKSNPGSTTLQDAKSFADNLANPETSPTSFSSAIDYGKGLNNAYRQTLTPGVAVPKGTINYAISSYKDNLQKNIDENGLGDVLQSSFDQANEASQIKNQIFNSVSSQKGKPVDSSFSNYVNNESPYVERGNFVNDYIPNSKNEGINKMVQFSQMVGDPDYAKQVLKNNMFNGKTDPNSFIKQYNTLSDEQQNFLFNPDDQAKITAFSNIKSNYPNYMKEGMFRTIINHILPGAIAGTAAAGAHAGGAGLGTEIAGALGVGGLAKLGNATLSGIGSLNPVKNAYINSINQTQPGLFQHFRDALTPSVVTPLSVQGNQ